MYVSKWELGGFLRVSSHFAYSNRNRLTLTGCKQASLCLDSSDKKKKKTGGNPPRFYVKAACASTTRPALHIHMAVTIVTIALQPQTPLQTL